jgi:hypothetical protein
MLNRYINQANHPYKWSFFIAIYPYIYMYTHTYIPDGTAIAHNPYGGAIIVPICPSRTYAGQNLGTGACHTDWPKNGNLPVSFDVDGTAYAEIRTAFCW